MDRYDNNELKGDAAKLRRDDDYSPSSDDRRAENQSMLRFFPQPIQGLDTIPAIHRVAAGTCLYPQLGGGNHISVPGLQDSASKDDCHRIYSQIYIGGNGRALWPSNDGVPATDELLHPHRLTAAGLVQQPSASTVGCTSKQSGLPSMSPPNPLDMNTSRSSSTSLHNESASLAEIMHRTGVQFPQHTAGYRERPPAGLAPNIAARQSSSLPAAVNRFSSMGESPQQWLEDRLLSQYSGSAPLFLNSLNDLAVLQQQRQQHHPSLSLLPTTSMRAPQPRAAATRLPWLLEPAQLAGDFGSHHLPGSLTTTVLAALRDDRSFPQDSSNAEAGGPEFSPPRQAEEDAHRQIEVGADALGSPTCSNERYVNHSTDGSHHGPPQVAAAAFMKEDLPIAEQIGKLPRPSRPLTAYNFFFRQERQAMIDKLPAGAIKEPSSRGRVRTGIPFHVMAKDIAAKWKELSVEGKRPFEHQAVVDRQRYGDEMIAFNAQKEELMRSHHQKRFRAVESEAWAKYCKEHSQKSRRNRR